MAERATKRERQYLLREGHLLGLITGGVLWRFTALWIVWFVVVFVLWFFSFRKVG